MSNKHCATPLPASSRKIVYDPSVAVAAFAAAGGGGGVGGGGGGGGDAGPRQPHFTPIAHFASTPASHPTGSLLDVNASYIVYAVKNGLVRVIDRRSGLRTLLRGHDRRISDVSFFGGDSTGAGGGASSSHSGDGGGGGGASDVLGTVGGEGDSSNVLVWRIFARDGELASEKLLEVRYKPAVRMIWHPFNPNQFVLVHRKERGKERGNDDDGAVTTTAARATIVETTRIFTLPHESEGHATCLCRPSSSSSSSSGAEDGGDEAAAAAFDGTVIEGAPQLRVEGNGGDGDAGGINDLSWSGMDARHVLTAHDDGRVRLWNLRAREEPKENEGKASTTEGPSAKCLMALDVTETGDDGGGDDGARGRAVTRCFFLSRYDDASASGGGSDGGGVDATRPEPGSFLTAPFVTGTNGNATVALWSPFTTTGSPPVKVRVFALDVPGPNFGLALAGGGDRPPSSFLLLADGNGGNLYAVHMTARMRGRGGTIGDVIDVGGTESVATGFDYVVPFRVVHPIFSWTVATSKSSSEADLPDGDGFEIDLFCVQSKAVQMLKLTSAMCAPPDPLPDNAPGLPPGVRSADVPSGPPRAVADDEEDIAAAAADEDGEGVGPDDVDYDDYDTEEGGDDGGGAPDDEEEEEEDDEPSTSPPPAASLPPPGLGPPSTTADASKDPFANWLGSIAAAAAATTTPAAAAAGVPATSPPPPTAAPPTTPVLGPPPGMTMGTATAVVAPDGVDGVVRLPLLDEVAGALPAPPPGMPPRAAAAAVASAGAADSKPPPPPVPSSTSGSATGGGESEARKGSPFLSPMELMKRPTPAEEGTGGPSGAAAAAASSAKEKGRGGRISKTSSDVSDMDKAAGALPSIPPASSKSQPPAARATSEPKTKSKPYGRSNTPKREPKATGGGKGKSSRQRGTSPTPPAAPSGKIAILKREGKAEPEPAISGGAATIAGAPVPAAVVPTMSKPEVDDAVRKTISSHFKKHESLVLSEIQKSVRSELQTTVLPALSKSVSQTVDQSATKPLRAAIDRGFSKESGKVRTAEVVDAVTEAVREPVVEAFQQTMRSVVVPAYESATRQMFDQISSSLEAGLAAAAADRRPPEDDGSRQLMESMAAKLDAMSQSIHELSAEVVQLRSLVASSGLGSASAGEAAARSPEPVDKTQIVRDEIVALLDRREYEAAFTKAVSTSSAETSVYACKNADLSAVLGGTPPALSQPILLCLMQQLGAILVTSTDADLRTELAWLQEIALTLDPNDESIRRHVRSVLQQLVSNINAKVAEGDPALRRPLQMLLQVIRGMGA